MKTTVLNTSIATSFPPNCDIRVKQCQKEKIEGCRTCSIRWLLIRWRQIWMLACSWLLEMDSV